MDTSASPAPVFGLKEAIDLYSKQTDFVQKIWGWLQVFCAGAAGFAWAATKEGAGEELKVPLLVGFCLVALGNGYLLVQAQLVAYRAAKAIHLYLEHRKDVENEFKDLASGFSASPPALVGIVHALFDLAVVYVIVKLMFPTWVS
jgi:hypothetical protein